MMATAFLGQLNSPKWLCDLSTSSYSNLSALPIICSTRLQTILAKHNLTPLARIVLRTIPMVAEYVNCHEKPVRRALSGNHIIKGK